MDFPYKKRKARRKWAPKRKAPRPAYATSGELELLNSAKGSRAMMSLVEAMAPSLWMMPMASNPDRDRQDVIEELVPKLGLLGIEFYSLSMYEREYLVRYYLNRPIRGRPNREDASSPLLARVAQAQKLAWLAQDRLGRWAIASRDSLKRQIEHQQSGTAKRPRR